MSNPAVDSAVEVALRDGGFVSLRRLTAEDADAVLDLHRNLTDRDRYFRFFTLHPAHLDQLVSDLTGPGDSRYAVGAFDDRHLIGVANYVVAEDPGAAEVAIVVAHEDHLRGVGTALLKHLTRVARARGIRRFYADVMSENALMLQVLSDFGWPRRRLADGSVLRFEIELADGDGPNAEVDDAPMTADRTTATGSAK